MFENNNNFQRNTLFNNNNEDFNFLPNNNNVERNDLFNNNNAIPNNPFNNQPQNLRAAAYAKNQIITIGFEMQPFSAETPRTNGQEEMFEEKVAIVRNLSINFEEIFTNPKTQVTYSNGDKYDGYFCNESKVRVKNGTYVWGNGDKYKGEFQNNLPHGEGTFTLNNGEAYIGKFSGGILNDEVKVHFSENNEKGLKMYQGLFANNMAYGKGKLFFEKGDLYKGQFYNGKFHGKGNLVYENGDMFDGKYVEGLPHGDGTFLHKSVNIFENKNLSNGLDRVNSREFDTKTFNPKEGKGKAIPVTMCQAAFHRKNPNTNLAKDLLGDLFNLKTKRVVNKNLLKKRAVKNLSRSRSRSVRKTEKKIKVMKRIKKRNINKKWCEIDFAKKFCTNKKFALTNRGNKKVDLREIFTINYEDQNFGLKRTKSMEITLKLAKQYLSRNNNMIIE